MRSFRIYSSSLSKLCYECCDWTACVASDCWGGLPVPPSGVIACGTQAVFDFVHASFHWHIGCAIGPVFSLDVGRIYLRDRNFGIEILLPLLHCITEGKFRNLAFLDLVNGSAH